MKVEILGTRGHITATAPSHSRHSGTLVDGTILLDLGEREYLDLHPKFIFITHLHSDHAFFIEDPIDRIDAEVFGPEGLDEVPWLQVITEPMEIDGYTITPVPTIHSQMVRSMAYIIEKDLEQFLYTGDLVTISRRFRDSISNQDMVIADGSFMRHNGLVRRDKKTNRLFGHTGIPNLVRLFSPITNKIIFSHFGSWFYQDIDESVKRIESFSNGTKVKAAYDGMTVEVGQSSYLEVLARKYGRND